MNTCEKTTHSTLPYFTQPTSEIRRALSLQLKFFLATIAVLFLSSCTTSQFKTGQSFVEDSPDFYLSIAPSFGNPFEYEISSGKIIFREYSGKGGYDWGKITNTIHKTIDANQQAKIRELTVTAVKDAVVSEQNGIDVVVVDGTSWYILSDYGFGPFLSISTNNPPDSFYAVKEYVENIFTIE